MLAGDRKMNRILLKIADELDEADRLGESRDAPEGMRYIIMSDTLAKELASTIRKVGLLVDDVYNP